MRIKSIRIHNFRLLKDIELLFESGMTVIVGRNNCGKTSLADIIRRFLYDKPVFKIEDFSSASYDGFCAALKAFKDGKTEDEIRTHIPSIELRCHIAYDLNSPAFGPLSHFIIDLNDATDEALFVCRYSLKSGCIEALFESHKDVAFDETTSEMSAESRSALFKDMATRIPALFAPTWWAEDPSDTSNIKPVMQSDVQALLACGFINAQRGLDGVNSRETDILAKVLEALFASASLATADDKQRNIAEGLEKAVEDIQGKIDEDFREQLRRLMPTITGFGYPGLEGQELHTETTLDVKRLLSNHTKVRYAGHNGVNLPESYNGLGVRNLLFILFQIVGFYRSYRAEPQAPGIHLIFIEEPEAHLHPQMQEVFIRALSDIAKKLSNEDGGDDWPVQFVVSTHSSHIANEAQFSAIRYFIVCSKDQPVGVCQTKVKDLRAGLNGQPKGDVDFLHQYLTLTRCDLFFADKAILIEGTSERLMIPQIIKKLHAAEPNLKVASQYITLLEVGGAYAYLFIPLLDFLELRTLIITDLDAVKSVKKKGKTRLHACAFHEGERTSNATIKHWFANKRITPAALIAKTEAEKIKDNRRIAFQLPEGDTGPCGRTFEDAFVLANKARFRLNGATDAQLEDAARAYAGDKNKADFALKHALRETGWTAPRYIVDGLRWLAQDRKPSELGSNLALVAKAAMSAEPDAVSIVDGLRWLAQDRKPSELDPNLALVARAAMSAEFDAVSAEAPERR